MGDIVVYDHLLNPHRFWVPQKDVRWWLRHYRNLGHTAMTLNQWKRARGRAYPPPPPHTDRVVETLRRYGIRNDGTVTLLPRDERTGTG